MGRRRTEQILQYIIPVDRRIYLLLYFEEKLLHKVLLGNLITAACILIAKYWETEVIPTKMEWESKCRYMALMYKLIAIHNFYMGQSQAWKKCYIGSLMYNIIMTKLVPICMQKYWRCYNIDL